jgi:microsomal epoxide hydrolase
MAGTMEITTSDNVALRVVSQGGGRPIVFIPGWTMTVEIWRGEFDAFSGCWNVVSFDPRGQGLSGKPEKGYGSRRRAQDIHEVLEKLQLKDAVLVGWSLGAIDVVNYMLLYGRDRIRGVLLVDNTVDRNFATGKPGARLMANLRSKSYDEVLQNFVVPLFNTPQTKAYLDEIQALSKLTPDFAAKEALASASTAEGLVEALKRSGLPCHYAVTKRFASEALKLREALPSQIGIEIYEAAGHALFVDEPERFHRILNSFLAGIP